jgi:cytochrome c-type biogenesis protein CcmH/NrfG
MKTESIAFGLAGVLFGLIVGWIIGTSQVPPGTRTPAAPAAASSSTTASDSSAAPPAQPTPVDQAQVNALTSLAEREPSNAAPRVQLGNLYFDAQHYDDAIKWYSEAVKLDPNNPDVSTDLGVSYYYTNQPDRALAQFDHSLKINPHHAKTLLNLGIVRAFGKQDLAGATQAWEQLVQLSPDSPEGQAAKQALDSLKSAHPGGLPGA